MSSEVMTHENWARLQVARRVRDIAKSMIRLSTLGRSIFPTRVHLRREAMNSPLVLRFRRQPSSMDLPQSIIPKIVVRAYDGCEHERPRCAGRLPGTGCGLPSFPSSPRGAGASLGPRAG